MRKHQSGVVLFVALMLLLILSMIGVTVARMQTVEERMARNDADFTLVFRRLCEAAAGPDGDMGVRSLFADPGAFDDWAARWRHRLAEEGGESTERRAPNPSSPRAGSFPPPHTFESPSRRNTGIGASASRNSASSRCVPVPWRATAVEPQSGQLAGTGSECPQ